MKLFVELGLQIGAFRRALNEARQMMATQIGAIADLAGKLSLAVSAPLALLAKSAFSSSAQLEQAAISFEVLTKSAEEGKRVMGELQKFAADTPFEFPELAGGAKKLLAFGFSVEQVIPLLRNAGDLASGMTVPIEEVVAVMGRLRAGDFGEAFDRLRDFGLSRDLLEGKGLEFDKQGSYQGSAKKALQVVTDLVNERFGGMTQKQAQTLSGLWSTAADGANMFLSDMGNKFVEVFDLKGKLKIIIDFLDRMKAAFNNLSPSMQKIILAFVAILAIVPPIIAAIAAAGSAIAAIPAGLLAALGPIALVIAAVAAVGYAVYENWDSIKKTLIDSGVWDALRNLFDQVGAFLAAWWKNASEMAVAAWEFIKAKVLPIVRQVWNGVLAVTRVAISMLSGLFKLLTGLVQRDWSKAWDGVKDIFGNLWNGIISVFLKGITTLNGLMADLFESIGMDSIANNFRKSSEVATKWLDKLRVDLEKVTTSADKANKKVENATTPEGKLNFNDIPDKPKDNSAAAAKEAKSALDAWEKLQKILTDANLVLTDKTRQDVQDVYNKYLEKENDIRELNIGAANKEIALATVRAVREKEIRDIIEAQNKLISTRRGLLPAFGGDPITNSFQERTLSDGTKIKPGFKPNQALSDLLDRKVAVDMEKVNTQIEKIVSNREQLTGFFNDLGVVGQTVALAMISASGSMQTFTQSALTGLMLVSEVGKTLTSGLAEGFQEMFMSGKTAFKGLINALVGLIAKIIATIAVAAILAAVMAATGLGAAGGAAGGGFGSIFKGLLGLGGKPGGAPGGILGGLLGVKMATGGIADGPRSGYLAMLHGREVVTPYSQAEAMLSGGGGTVVNVQVVQDGFGAWYQNNKMEDRNTLIRG